MPIQGVVGTDSVTVSTTPVALPNPIPGKTMKPMGGEVTVDVGDIIWSSDPNANLATDGHLAVEGTAISLPGWGMVKHFRAVRSGGADATITYTLGSDASP